MSDGHQDFNQVIIRRSGEYTNAARHSIGTSISRARSAPASVAGIKRLDSDDPVPLATVSRSLSQQLQQARAAKKMTQKELATAINVKVDLIRDYENGKAIPDSNIMQKMSRALGVPLRK